MTNFRMLSAIILLLQLSSQVAALSTTARRAVDLRTTRQNPSHLLASMNENEEHKENNNHPLLAASLAAVIASGVAFNPMPAHAYVPSDYASDTVQNVIGELKQASGNVDATFKAYENIAGIITEGKGVGGMVNYSESDADVWKVTTSWRRR